VRNQGQKTLHMHSLHVNAMTVQRHINVWKQGPVAKHAHCGVTMIRSKDPHRACLRIQTFTKDIFTVCGSMQAAHDQLGHCDGVEFAV